MINKYAYERLATVKHIDTTRLLSLLDIITSMGIYCHVTSPDSALSIEDLDLYASSLRFEHVHGEYYLDIGVSDTDICYYIVADDREWCETVPFNGDGLPIEVYEPLVQLLMVQQRYFELLDVDDNQ